ncbi:MAG: hypothetical protein GAK35_02219 [Herbaspirillum frisingense]|uniref:Uncharacterized protein n=1 Tax=Herbaspirillum frisingense TaxID=92645 RepID=A0A7V8JU09_9BURK|nr:MAG: hypothetical protein GAK35_02219 [Herbaspirillum frisingense]
MKEQVVVRLDEDVYRQLERTLVPPVVTNDTTGILAGYQLGVQDVLRKLRDGFTASR